MTNTAPENLYLYAAVVDANGYWGTGPTLDAALAVAEAEAGQPLGYEAQHVGYHFPKGVSAAWIDDMGGLCWQWASEELMDDSQPTEVSRHSGGAA